MASCYGGGATGQCYGMGGEEKLSLPWKWPGTNIKVTDGKKELLGLSRFLFVRHPNNINHSETKHLHQGGRRQRGALQRRPRLFQERGWAGARPAIDERRDQRWTLLAVWRQVWKPGNVLFAYSICIIYKKYLSHGRLKARRRSPSTSSHTLPSCSGSPTLMTGCGWTQKYGKILSSGKIVSFTEKEENP